MPTENLIQPTRNIRFSDLIDIDRLESTPVAIIGCGAIGKRVAEMLAQAGTTRLTLVDPDTIDTENLGPQGWNHEDLNTRKVDALDEYCEAVNSYTFCTVFPEEFEPHHLEDTEAVFLCVDNMEVRRQIAEEAFAQGLPFYDARMGSQIARVLAVRTEEEYEHWLANWFPDSEGVAEPCTLKATPYCASVCAGLLVSEYMKLFQKTPILNRDLTYDLFASTVALA